MSRTREVRHGQEAPAAHGVLGGTRPHGVPAVTVPGRVLRVRASTPVPNRPWRVEPSLWHSLLGTSQCDSSSEAWEQQPLFLPGPLCPTVSCVRLRLAGGHVTPQLQEIAAWLRRELEGLLSSVPTLEASKSTSRFEVFASANNIDELKKAQVFLTVLDEKAYVTLRSLLLPKSPADSKYADITKVLREHYAPRRSIVTERYRFHRRDQGQSETIGEFVVKLKKLAATCEFGSFLEESLRDRLISGLRSEDIRCRLLSLPNKEATWERVLNIATAMETAKNDTKEILPAPADVNWQNKPTPKKEANEQKQNRDRKWDCPLETWEAAERRTFSRGDKENVSGVVMSILLGHVRFCGVNVSNVRKSAMLLKCVELNKCIALTKAQQKRNCWQ
ncbi:hypothetical protein MTO96_035179 [Rhipicephalus appendiculatus]